MRTVASELIHAQQVLQERGLDKADSLLEAQLLLAFALNTTRSYLYTHANSSLSENESERFTDYLNRRAQGEPLAYITGHKEFWSLDLLVTRDTLIPRPETELIVEIALSLFPAEANIKVADLGTGSGAIGLAIAHERSNWEVHASDISEKALQIASNNAQRLEIDNISFWQGSWCSALPSHDFDIIISNPPYLSEEDWVKFGPGLLYEPYQALVTKEQGLAAINTIVTSSKAYLKQPGYLLIEHGYLQGEAIRSLFKAVGFGAVCTKKDLAGQERVTQGIFYLPNA